MTVATAVAVAAAIVALGAVIVALLALRRVQAHATSLEAEIERGKREFDDVVAREVEQRSVELAQMLARSRADSLSQLAEEERRIAEERRREVVERERDAGTRLAAMLTDAQR